jgi:hypothetical protein
MCIRTSVNGIYRGIPSFPEDVFPRNAQARITTEDLHKMCRERWEKFQHDSEHLLAVEQLRQDLYAEAREEEMRTVCSCERLKVQYGENYCSTWRPRQNALPSNLAWFRAVKIKASDIVIHREF